MASGNNYTIFINTRACTLTNDFFILPPKLTIAYAYSLLNEYSGNYVLRNLSLLWNLELRDNLYFNELNLQIQPGQNPLTIPEIFREQITGNNDTTVNNLRFNSTVPGDLGSSEDFPNDIVIIKNDTQTIITRDSIPNNTTLKEILKLSKELIKDPEGNLLMYINAGRSLCLTINQLADSNTLESENQLIKEISRVFTPVIAGRLDILKLPKNKQRKEADKFKITTLKALCLFCINNGYIQEMPAGTQFCRTINEKNHWGGKGITFMNCNGRGNWNISGSCLTHVGVVELIKDCMYIDMTYLCFILGAIIKEGGGQRGLFSACCEYHIVKTVINILNKMGYPVDGFIFFDSVDNIEKDLLDGDKVIVHGKGDDKALPNSYTQYFEADVQNRICVIAQEPFSKQIEYSYPEFITVGSENSPGVEEKIKMVGMIPIDNFYKGEGLPDGSPNFLTNFNDYIIPEVDYGKGSETLISRAAYELKFSSYPYLKGVDTLSLIQGVIKRLQDTTREDTVDSIAKLNFKEYNKVVDAELKRLNRVEEIDNRKMSYYVNRIKNHINVHTGLLIDSKQVLPFQQDIVKFANFLNQEFEYGGILTEATVEQKIDEIAPGLFSHVIEGITDYKVNMIKLSLGENFLEPLESDGFSLIY
tara:strand:- start:728 stop:2665 length:1938 start_codon:yes stop_codon:yes gene_type:complete